MLLHEVITAEKVPFTYRVAGMGSRFLAWLADMSLVLLLFVAGLMVATVFEAAKGGLGTAVFLFWLFCLNWGYFLLFEWLWHGQTPGKRLLGIRVIDRNGTSMSFFQVAVRNVLRVADAMPSLPGALLAGIGAYGAGFVIAGSNPAHRRLGDLAAGTLVVHVERRGRLIRALHEAAGPIDTSRAGLARQRLGLLDRAQKQALLDLCLRREQLGVADRSKLFRAVAQFFEARFGLAPDEYQSDEKFVLQMASALTAE